MINGYSIKRINDEEVLFLYMDFDSEFARIDKKNNIKFVIDKTNFLSYINNYKNDPAEIDANIVSFRRFKILSKDFNFVRVDFYNENDKLIFGELTFTPGAGFDKCSSYEFDKKIGSWMSLKEE